ncbi:MAG: amidohydrolase family protein [Acidobacteria bacterium]|nr:amidohydrolase family protein [Acidobacteriota bacterium]
MKTRGDQDGAGVIKNCSTGECSRWAMIRKASQYTLEEMKTIVGEAHRLGRKVAAYTHGGDGIKLAVLAGVDSIEHGSYIDDEGVKLMKERGVYLNPTLYLTDLVPRKLPDWAFRHRSSQKLIMPGHYEDKHRKPCSGCACCLWNGCGGLSARTQRKEFNVYVKLGMTPLQADFRLRPSMLQNCLVWKIALDRSMPANTPTSLPSTAIRSRMLRNPKESNGSYRRADQ